MSAEGLLAERFGMPGDGYGGVSRPASSARSVEDHSVLRSAYPACLSRPGSASATHYDLHSPPVSSASVPRAQPPSGAYPKLTPLRTSLSNASMRSVRSLQACPEEAETEPCATGRDGAPCSAASSAAPPQCPTRW